MSMWSAGVRTVASGLVAPFSAPDGSASDHLYRAVRANEIESTRASGRQTTIIRSLA